MTNFLRDLLEDLGRDVEAQRVYLDGLVRTCRQDRDPVARLVDACQRRVIGLVGGDVTETERERYAAFARLLAVFIVGYQQLVGVEASAPDNESRDGSPLLDALIREVADRAEHYAGLMELSDEAQVSVFQGLYAEMAATCEAATDMVERERLQCALRVGCAVGTLSAAAAMPAYRRDSSTLPKPTSLVYLLPMPPHVH